MNRSIKRVPIQGMDISRSDKIVDDGCCQKIYNMRFRDGAWYNVCRHKSVDSFPSADGYSVIYQHPVLPEHDYIALKDNKLYHVYVLAGSISSKMLLVSFEDGAENIKCTHFGNVLYVNYEISAGIRRKIFIYEEGVFCTFNLDEIEPINQISIDYTHLSTIATTGEISTEMVRVEMESVDSSTVKEVSRLDSSAVAVLHNDDYITGVVYLIFAYRLIDGSVVRNSNIYTLQTEGFTLGDAKGLYRRKDGVFYKYYMMISGCKPSIKYTVPQNVRDNKFIKSVVVYATRNNPIYDFDDVHKKFNTDNASIVSNYYVTSRNCLHSQVGLDTIKTPFYEIDEFEIPSYENINMKLTYSKHFKDIVHNPLYTPSYSVHNTIAGGVLDYNNRLHCYDLHTTLYKGSDLLVPVFKVAGQTYHRYNDPTLKFLQYVTINAGTSSHKVVCCQSAGECYVTNVSGTGPRYIFLPNVITYPDNRAEKIEIFAKSGGLPTIKVASFNLKKASASNFAYYMQPSSNQMIVLMRLVYDPQSIESVPPGVDDSFSESNKIIVSAHSNPFVFEPRHTYSIETDSSVAITDINSSADQLTETRYGAHPVIIFSSKGIYALEQGSDEVLYSRTLLVSKDVALKNCRSQSIGGAIFFISQRGVMFLEGRVAKVLSLAVDRFSDIDNDDFSKYIESATINHNPRYNEMLFYNKDYDYAYILSLNNFFWSTRAFSGKRLNEKLFVTSSAILDVSVSEDQSRPLTSEVITRPLKLDNDSFKRIDVLTTPTSGTSGVSYQITLYGSNDFIVWDVIRSVDSYNRIRRTSASWRYYKVKITSSGLAQLPSPAIFSLMFFDIEYFNRFNRHLRD